MAKVCQYPDDWRDYWEDRWDELVDEGDILNWSDDWDEVNDFLQDLWDAMNDHNYPPTSGLTNQQLIQFYYYLYPPSPAELARRFGDSFLDDYIPALQQYIETLPPNTITLDTVLDYIHNYNYNQLLDSEGDLKLKPTFAYSVILDQNNVVVEKMRSYVLQSLPPHSDGTVINPGLGYNSMIIIPLKDPQTGATTTSRVEIEISFELEYLH